MNDPAQESPSPSEPRPIGGSKTWRKWIVATMVVVVLGVLYYRYQGQLSLEQLVGHEQQLLAFKDSRPVLVYGGALLLYVIVTGISLPGAAVMTLLYGKFFGFWQGLVLVSFGSTTGATVAFLISRYLLRDAIQAKFGKRLTGFNQALEREGAFYLFTLRLIPVVPFFVINLVMGLTPIRTATFWWVSQVGMLAGTAVYVYAGTTLPSLQQIVERGAGGVLTPQLIAAFVILGLFPLVVKKLVNSLRKTEVDAEK
jgi:uncharacterized membrane protein YdjX (TVP38/TMEM64 family)